MSKKILKIIFLLIAISFFAFFNFEETKCSDCKDACEVAYPTDADSDAREDCKDNCEEIEKKADKAEDYRKLIEQKEKQGEKISDQLQYIDYQQSINQQNLQEMTTQIKTLEEKITDTENEIQEKEKNIKYQRTILSGLMQSYYDYDRQGILDIVLLDKSFSESFSFSQADYIEQSEIKVGKILEEIKKTQQELKDKKKELEDDYDQNNKLKDKLQYEKTSLQMTENEKQSLLKQTQAEKAKYEKLLKQIEDEIWNLESGKSVDYSKIPAAKGDYFDYPVSSVRITQGYGMTSFAKAGAYGGKPHNGIDFGISVGNNIYSARSGKVLMIGNNGRYAYGRWIAVDHQDGLVTLYGHLSKQSVSKGEKVSTGEKIGESGNTGYSTGPHLHFSVFTKSSFETVESKYVDGLMIPVSASVNPNNYF